MKIQSMQFLFPLVSQGNSMEPASLRILIIDDSDLSCALLSVILRSDNYTIVGIAQDATTGIKLAQSSQPDVVLLDIIMPEISGLDAIKPIKAAAKNALVLMVSGVDDGDMVTQAIEQGANGYIIKPFNSDSVIKTMKKVKEKFVLAHAAQ
jgi:two-component system chemotaxis response regulator CheY